MAELTPSQLQRMELARGLEALRFVAKQKDFGLTEAEMVTLDEAEVLLEHLYHGRAR